MKRKIVILFAAAAAGFHLSPVAGAADFAFEVRCEQQYSTAELQDLTWSQGSTPLIAARTYRRGKPEAPEAGVEVEMLIAPSATAEKWAKVTAQATNSTSYLLQWPTIGTNTTAKAPWYYTIYFLRDGHRYWTGSGCLWIEETSATGDGVIWQDVISGDLTWVSNRFDMVAHDIATNAQAIAELEESLESATNALAEADAALAGRIDGLWGRWPAGGTTRTISRWMGTRQGCCRGR